MLLLLLLAFGTATAALPQVDTRDVSVAISQDAIDSASSVYTAAGELQYSGHLPDNTTTSVLQKLIPKAYALCPDCPINFNVAATAPPRATLAASTGAELDVSNAVVHLTATPFSGPSVDLLTLGLNASCGLNFSAVPASSGDYVKAKITIVQLRLSVESSNVGILPNAAVALLNPLVNKFLQDVAIPAFNAKFQGFPLPSVSGFDISDFLISTNDGYVGVGLNILPTMSSTGIVERNSSNTSSSTTTTTTTTNTSIRTPPLVPTRMRKLITARPYVTTNPPGFNGPGVIVSIGGNGLNKILKGLLPKIISQINGMKIPPMSGKASGIEYSIGEIILNGFTIGQSSLTFVKGKGLNLILGGLGLQIPSTSFDIKKKILFTHISCGGHFDGNLGGTSVNEGINVTAVEPAGTPKITPTSTWTWGSLSVNVKLHNIFCKIIKDIASWFIGNINSKIENVIKQKIPTVVNNLINNAGNKILQNLVLAKKIDKNAEVTFSLTQNPTSANNALSVYLSGEFIKPPSFTEE